MHTVISSPTREVKIGPDLPFVIIGERINPTGRKLLAQEMAAGNFERVRADAIAQVAAGAHMLDVNAGIPLADEPGILAEAIRVVQSVTDVPLSIDSSIIAALERGLATYKGKALVNSVTGEEERLETVLPLVKKYGAAVIGIANDESGISQDAKGRLQIARRIIERAEALGIPREDVIIDPLALPVGAARYAGDTLFKTTRRIREELGANSICGASNISFGLPDRQVINATFLAMAIAAGMTCAITNPLEEQIIKTILAANVMMGHDEHCQAWVQAHLATNEEARAERAARRERRRTASS